MSKLHVVIVTGSRSATRNDEVLVEARLQSLYETLTVPLVVLTGGADGVDLFADQWARRMRRNGAKVYPIPQPAEWALFSWLGRKGFAGPVRNEQVLQHALVLKKMAGAELSCLAFPKPALPGTNPKSVSPGTKDMMGRCRREVVPVTVTELEGK